ncbi:MAG: exo-alpha-sialidase [Pirellulales bacterium]|nr:exo-alpha-sialidase [Pirellulales bacterium]
MNRCWPLVAVFWMLLPLGASAQAPAEAEAMKVDLSAPDATAGWVFSADTGTIRDGQLVLDGREEMCRAFYAPWQFADVALEAGFLVDPAPQGVLACGFIVRARDAATYYYVHFDRTQAILVRSDQHQTWNEIKRVGGLEKPAGQWHQGRLECCGDKLRVWLNGKMLYEAQDAALAGGRIGFYANQGIAHVKDIVVRGKPQKAETALVVPPPMHVFVCKDAGAGAYEAFPDVCRLSDGRLLSVFYAGYGHVAMPNEQLPKGGRISYATSSDEGRTWSQSKTLFDSPDDDRDPSIVQLRNGLVICNFFSLRKAEGQGGPWKGLGTWIVTSSDLGETWSEPRQIYEDYYCSAPIRELSDGRLVLGLYKETAASAQGAVGISDDGGKTWRPAIDIDNGGVRLDAETDLIELKDGTLYAAQRPAMCYAVSKDRGETWTVSKPMGFPGHCPSFLRTADGIILLAHRVPSTSLHYSLDECNSWSENVLVDTVGGAYPSMVNLKDGTVLIVYYEEGAGSSIRAKRFRASAKGIEWLPLK